MWCRSLPLRDVRAYLLLTLLGYTTLGENAMPLSAQEVESINERFAAWVNETSGSMGVSRHDVMVTSLFGAACYFEVVLGKIEAKHLIDQVASTVGTIPLPYVPSWSGQENY